MTKRRRLPRLVTDMEKPFPTVADSKGDELGGTPLAIKLGDPWSDFMRVPDESNNGATPKRSPSAVPLLDDMKGILQWD
jgi:hypothetical protein